MKPKVKFSLCVRSCRVTDCSELSVLSVRISWNRALYQRRKMFQMLQMLLLLGLVSQHASGVEVEVEEGVESVLLPCQVPDKDSINSVVLWNRDEFKIPKVYARLKNGADDLQDQNERYFGRTSLRADAQQTGDLSLTLRKPKVSDSGNYTCIARKQGEAVNTVVQLKVKEPPPLWLIFLAVLGTMLIMAFIVSVFMWLKNKRMENTRASQIKAVEVTEGTEEVHLSVTTKTAMPEDGSVVWARIQPESKTVCVYKDGQVQTDSVDQDYKGRTDMKITQETDGRHRLTLTLRKPGCKDGGVYFCITYDKDINVLKGKAVVLWVKETWGTTIKSALPGHKDYITPRAVSLENLRRLLTEIPGEPATYENYETYATSENNESSPLNADPGV